MSQSIRRIAVFCGSGNGADPSLLRHAYRVGCGLATRGIGLVYGGGRSGLMREVSQGALDGGGEVFGVSTRSMIEREWNREDLTELHMVETVHERKSMMGGLADAFLCLPGGLGTLEEILEVWSWRQMGFDYGPIGFLNVGGFWTPLLDAVNTLVAAGFVRRDALDDVIVADDVGEAVDGLIIRAACHS